MHRFLVHCLFFAGLSAASSTLAQAAATKPAAPPPPSDSPAASSVDVSVTNPLTIGYLSPTFGTVMLGVPSDTPAPLIGGLLTTTPDFAASYRAQLNRSQFGLSAGYINGGSLFTAAPTAGWNLGASVGYAGFYVHAGISDALQQHTLLNDPSKGWLAGFGYQTGGLNLRLSYMTAQTPFTGDADSRTWMIGGIYQLSSRLRVNADAFTSRDQHLLSAAPVNPSPGAAAAPQGTGARVGVQLRF